LALVFWGGSLCCCGCCCCPWWRWRWWPSIQIEEKCVTWSNPSYILERIEEAIVVTPLITQKKDGFFFGKREREREKKRKERVIYGVVGTRDETVVL